MISTRKFKIVTFLLLLAPIFLVNGCFTMKYDFKGGVSIRPDIKTFSVQYFDNRAKYIDPTYSQKFTDALREYIEKNTNLRYVNGLGDVDFSGTIQTYESSLKTVASGEKAAMLRFTIGVKFSYLDTKEPKGDFEKTVSAFREYENTIDFSAAQELYSNAITDELIELVFNAAFVNW
jgi:hypothetical protein